MKKSLILLLGAFLFVLSMGCMKEETELKQVDNVPSVNIGDNQPDGSDTGNGQVTERANCNCTITALSSTPVIVDICGVPTGINTCTTTCFSTMAPYLASLTLSLGNTFNIPMGEPFRVTNTNAFRVQFTVNCGGSPIGGVTFGLNPGDFKQFGTNSNCDLSNC